MSDDSIPRLLPALHALSEWLAATRTPYLVIGGTAVAILGRPRATLDIDAVVLTDETAVAGFIDSGLAFGFRTRIPDPVDFARRARILLLAHEPSGTGVDISLAGLPFEKESIARGTTVRAQGIEFRVPQVEDLIIMKAVAGRELDFADIDTLLNMHPQVDARHIRNWVRDFAEVLEAPETLARVERLLAIRRLPAKRKKKKA